MAKRLGKGRNQARRRLCRGWHSAKFASAKSPSPSAFYRGGLGKYSPRRFGYSPGEEKVIRSAPCQMCGRRVSGLRRVGCGASRQRTATWTQGKHRQSLKLRRELDSPSAVMRFTVCAPSPSALFAESTSCSPCPPLRRVPSLPRPSPLFAGAALRREERFAEVVFRRGSIFAECRLLKYGSANLDQMVTWEASSPREDLGEDARLGEAKSQVTIWSLEHLFAECPSRQRALRRVPYSAKWMQFSRISLFLQKNLHLKHNMHIYSSFMTISLTAHPEEYTQQFTSIYTHN